MMAIRLAYPLGFRSPVRIVQTKYARSAVLSDQSKETFAAADNRNKGGESRFGAAPKPIR
jgi:hypothetical protein